MRPQSPPKKPGIYLLDDDFEQTLSNSHPMLKEDYVVLEEGALVPGGAISLVSKDALAIFAQYFAIGIVYAAIPGVSYPLVKNYFDAQGYQSKTYSTLVNIAWSFKIFMGGLSDLVPIMGLRRKPWMMIGWLVCIASLVVLSSLSPGPPAQPLHLKNKADPTFPFYNSPLPTYTLLSMLATFGYVTSDCASDALVVQYAMREPLATRGRIQTAIYTVRAMGQILSNLFVGICLNSHDFGGKFNFSISINVFYIILLIPCLVAMTATTTMLTEHKTEMVPFRKWIHQFWQLTQKQAMWQILAFRFINNVFQNYESTAPSPLGQYWAGVQPFMEGITKAIGYVIYTAILATVGRYGLNWNWRWTIAITSIALVVIDGTVYFLTIWDVVRNPWFYTGVTLTDQIPGGVRFIVSAFVATELADLGNEGAVYGLVTTVSNLTTPVSSVIYKLIDSYFYLTNDNFQKEANDTLSDEAFRSWMRWNVTSSFLVAYGMKLFALVWLFLLPPQKAHVQRLKRYGRVSPFAGGLSMFLFFFFLAFSLFFNLTSMFPDTAWWRIAGGSGKRPTTAAPKPTTTLKL
ncbi:hypothetical protein AC1031_015055 [Aphanomyces cochlioides]|nr:hypothetical protein AC1031_015055 [Aphanomyces cochlioides]